MKKALAVIIGRFQPPHEGHLKLIEKGLELAERVLVLIGSANKARSCKNPFTFGERHEMLNLLTSDHGECIRIHPLIDLLSEESWGQQVISCVRLYQGYFEADDESMVIIGCDKDHSSYYLHTFPQWETVLVEQHEGLNSTDIRAALLGSHVVGNVLADPERTGLRFLRYIQGLTNAGTHDWFQRLKEEYRFVQDYKRSWARSPFPPMLVTVDILVEWGGYILLITRKNHPGRGLRAMPGGFVDVNETILQAAVRELKEETGLEADPGELIFMDVVDTPDRSLLGRTITHVYTYHPVMTGIYALAGDDAQSVDWHVFGDLNPTDFFSDHYLIIESILNNNEQETPCLE